MSLRASAGGVETLTTGNGVFNTGTAQAPNLNATTATPSQNTVATPGTSLANATPANVTSKVFGIGAYLVWGVVDFLATSATATDFQCGISNANNTLLGQAGGSGIGPDPNGNAPYNTTALTTETVVVNCGPTIVTLAAGATIYLNAQASFSAGTVSAFGTLSVMQLR